MTGQAPIPTAEHDDTAEPMPTRADCIAAAGRWLADALDLLDQTPPRQVAEQSNAVASGTMTIDQVEDLVRADRGLPPLDRTTTAAADVATTGR